MSQQPGLDSNIANPRPATHSPDSAAQVAERNRLLEARIEQVQGILRAALEARHAIDFDALKRSAPFLVPEPDLPRYLEYPPEPHENDPRYRPAPSAPAFSEQQKRGAYEQFVREYTAWAEGVRKIESENERRYEASVAAVRQWHSACRQHHQEEETANAAVEQQQQDYLARIPAAVADYCRAVLHAATFPADLPRVFELRYHAASRSVLVDHVLPQPSDLPRVNGVKVVKSRSEYAEVALSETALHRLHADLVYQVCLRTVHELFDADAAGAVDTVIFNGWLEGRPGTVAGSKTCVITLSAGKEEFQALNLWDTDPKAAFKILKGIAPSKPHALMPVDPATLPGEPGEPL
ncbi:MAG: hypothetical protein U1F98_02440 [Verrucomicrobiota bacterium]